MEVQQSEEAAKKKEFDNDTLKKVIKSKNSEQDILFTDIKKVKQALKSKEKEVHNLENLKFNHLDKIKALKEDANRIKREKAVLEKKLTSSEKKNLNNRNKKIPSKAVGKCLISESEKLFPLNSVKMDLANTFSNNNTCAMDKTTSLDSPVNNSPKLNSNKFEVLSKGNLCEY